MNRSILIVICDFLLLSLLTFSTDLSKMAEDEDSHAAPPPVVATNQVDKAREQLNAELASTRAEADARAQKLAEAQAAIEKLNTELHAASTDASNTKKKLSATETKAKKESEKTAALEDQLVQLRKSNQTMAAEAKQLTQKLAAAEKGRTQARSQADVLAEEVKTDQAHGQELAAGLKALTGTGTGPGGGIQGGVPVSADVLFNNFVTTRAQLNFNAMKGGLPSVTRHKQSEAVLVTDGQGIYALCHLQDTPLTLSEPIVDWDKLTGTLGHKVMFPIRSLSFDSRDPRVVWIPITTLEAKDVGCSVYPISAAGHFDDVVLIGSQNGYYGECKFERDSSTPNYMKLDKSSMVPLLGSCNPARGDLVFSKTSELLGIMVNENYCLTVSGFNAGLTIEFSDDVKPQHTAIVLSSISAKTARLPAKVQ